MSTSSQGHWKSTWSQPFYMPGGLPPTALPIPLTYLFSLAGFFLLDACDFAA
jgi:hypothetical protein